MLEGYLPQIRLFFLLVLVVKLTCLYFSISVTTLLKRILFQIKLVLLKLQEGGHYLAMQLIKRMIQKIVQEETGLLNQRLQEIQNALDLVQENGAGIRVEELNKSTPYLIIFPENVPQKDAVELRKSLEDLGIRSIVIGADNLTLLRFNSTS